MRKAVSAHFLSLDGVAESPDQFISEWAEATDAGGAALIATQDAVILGRRRHDEWSAFWPGSAIEPFATFINGVTKYVATSTPHADWASATAITGELVAFVQDEAPAGWRHRRARHISVTQALLAADVVDELRS